MWRRRKDNLKRRMMSGILACLLVATSLTNTVGIITAFAGETANTPRVSYSYDSLRDSRGNLEKMVQINVQAENESFAPGSEMVLKVYVQNLSDETLTGGSLKWTGKGLENAGFLDEEEEDLFNGPGWTGEDGSGDSGLMEEIGSFSITSQRKSVPLRIDSAEEESEAPEGYLEAAADIESEEEGDSAGPETDGEGKRIRGIELAPGEVYETRFYGTVEEAAAIATKKVSFEFLAGTDDGKVAQDKAEFTYNTGMALVLPIEFDDGPALMTNELNTMYIHTRFEDEGILDEYTWNFTDEEEATPSNAERHEITVATLSNGTEEDSKEGTSPVNMKYSIVTYGAKLEGINAWYDNDRSGWGETVTGVSFRVKDNTEPGVYFGQVTTSIRRNGKSYKTTQGFHFFVLGDGQLVLKGSINGAEIQVKGDRTSFPAGDMLSLKVTEVPAEKMDLVQEAMAQKAEELGVSVDKMKAMDIKVIADGVEQELEGEVEVTFSNLKLEKVEENITAAGEEDEIEEEEAEEFEEISSFSVLGLRNAGALEEDQAEEAAEEETEAGEETEESTLAVWHLDEEAGAIDEMDSEVTDDGDVVMVTEHFSIYIVVDMGQLGGNVTLIVEHWGKNIETINADGTTDPYHIRLDKGTDSDERRYGYYTVDDVYDRHSQKIVTQLYNVQLYSSDTIMIPNNKQYESIEELSKVCLVTAKKEYAEKNYEIVEVWVSSALENRDKATYEEWRDPKQKYTVTRDAQGNITNNDTVRLTKNSIIRFVYKEKNVASQYYQPVTFYDHNVTNGGLGVEVSSVQYRNDEGTNNPSNFTGGDKKMGVGQYASGNGTSSATDSPNTWYNVHTDVTGLKGYLNRGNNAQGKSAGITYDNDLPASNLISAVVRNEVKENLTSDYKLQFHDRISQPGFFEVKTGTKKFTNYKLGFRQTGDTYVLSTVTRDNTLELSGLENIHYSAHSGGSVDSNIYSNEFWPLDKEKYSATYTFADPQVTNFSDDLKTHNWHFGMHYAFTFNVGEYTGPMNFYFRGDDDFWMFVDGKRVIDLGGIHSAVGQAVNMRTWLENNGGVSGEHRMDIYYMERGGYGSCCYMQFTLPNCIPIDSQKEPETQVTVKKVWDDNNNPNRPDEIDITLWQMYNDIMVDKGTVTLSKANNWQYTWTELPISDPNDKTRQYDYEVVEKNVPPGYDSQTIKKEGSDTTGWTITVENRLDPEVKVKVTKKWEDDSNKCDNRPDTVRFQLYADGKPLADKILTLNKSDADTWVGEFTGLPMYRYEKDSSGNYIKDQDGNYKEIKIVYTVSELDGNTAIPENGSLPGNHANYTVTYKILSTAGIDNDYVTHVQITNAHTCETVSRKAVKEWEGIPSDSSIEATAKIGLYYKKGADWELVDISTSTNPVTVSWPTDIDLKVEWTDLPKYAGKDEIEYAVFEVNADDEPISQSGSEVVLGDYKYKVTFEDATAAEVTITNELIKARLRVGKWIDNEEIHDDVMDDEFIITVTSEETVNGDTPKFETGVVLKPAGYGKQVTGIVEDYSDSAYRLSKYIEVLAKAEGSNYVIGEMTNLKEYSPSELFITKYRGEDILSGAVITVKPGSDDIVLVHNTFGHKDYFHDDDSKTNEFNGAEQKPLQVAQRQVVNIYAAIPERRTDDDPEKIDEDTRLT